MTIGNGVTNIGNCAFMYCSSLTSVHISDLAAWCKISFGSTSFNYAYHLYFNGQEVTNLVIPDNVTSISDNAFAYSGLTSVTIGNSVTSIGNHAFEYCSGLTYVIIGSGVKFIGYRAFRNCTSLTSVHILDLAAWCDIDFDSEVYLLGGSGNPLRVAHHLFYKGNEVKNLVIPEGVTSIRAYAFDGCSDLTSITIPNSVTEIERNAFYDCKNLKTISIGYGIKSINSYAFGSQKLTDVYCYAEEVPSTASNAFYCNVEMSTLHVPASSIDLYKLTTPWANFGNIVSLWSGDNIEIPHDEVTLTANSYSRAYGEANPTFGYMVTEGTIASGTPTISCEATATSPVGTYDIVIAKGTVSNNTVSLVKGTLTITKAPLKVSVKDVEREQGEENPQFELVYEGWKLQDTESVLLKKPVATTTATKESKPGTYPITVSGGEARNYELRYVNGRLTVTIPSSINELMESETFDVYDMSGRKVRRQATTLKDLPKGVYIIDGKKIVVR